MFDVISLFPSSMNVLYTWLAGHSVQCASISESPDMLLAEGKRCLAAGDANGAVECFQEACGLLWVVVSDPSDIIDTIWC